jgi:hypothetical protein
LPVAGHFGLLIAVESSPIARHFATNATKTGRRVLAALTLAIATLVPGAIPAGAAAGNLVADVITPEGAVPEIGVTFDGQYLYYTERNGTVLHRINVPPACASPCMTTVATGHVDIPITAPLNPLGSVGINAMSYDSRRGVFWAAGGDGLSIYQLTKTGIATLAFQIDPVLGRPGACHTTLCFSMLVDGLAYDAADDTLWYKSDASNRTYHYLSHGDLLGHAILAPTPYIDTDVAPNDLAAQCGFNYPSWVVVGGTDLFYGADKCQYYFEYTKTGTKVGWAVYNTRGTPDGDAECDNLSYTVPVFWARDAFDGHIRAFEQPALRACVYGGG